MAVLRSQPLVKRHWMDQKYCDLGPTAIKVIIPPRRRSEDQLFGMTKIPKCDKSHNSYKSIDPSAFFAAIEDPPPGQPGA